MKIPLREFCELHGKSYDAARANGVVFWLLKARKAVRYGSRGPVYVTAGTPWPQGYSVQLGKKRRISLMTKTKRGEIASKKASEK